MPMTSRRLREPPLEERRYFCLLLLYISRAPHLALSHFRRWLAYKHRHAYLCRLFVLRFGFAVHRHRCNLLSPVPRLMICCLI